MNSDEKGKRHMPMICGALVLLALAVAGDWWVKQNFAASETQAAAEVKVPSLSVASQTPPPRPPEASVPGVENSDAQMESQLGMLMAQQNRTEDALGHYREAVRLYREQLRQSPDSVERLNNLAWLLASNPFSEIRNGQDAISFAKHACELTDWRKAVAIGTLGAAYAEAGQFDDAVKMAEKARIVALANGQPDVASRNENLMKLYQERKPYREAY